MYAAVAPREFAESDKRQTSLAAIEQVMADHAGRPARAWWMPKARKEVRGIEGPAIEVMVRE